MQRFFNSELSIGTSREQPAPSSGVDDGEMVDMQRRQAAPDDHDLFLLASIAGGDADALGRLYDAYGARLYSVALYVTNDPGSAEEITQDVFAWLATNAATFDAGRGRLEPWLARLTRNRAIDWLRSRHGARREREVPLPEVLLADDRSDVALTVQRQVDLAEALAALPPEQREAIELTFWLGLSPKEIAAWSDCPQQTIYTRLRTGLDKLRANLLQDEH